MVSWQATQMAASSSSQAPICFEIQIAAAAVLQMPTLLKGGCKANATL
jgi:hypothetical protein